MGLRPKYLKEVARCNNLKFCVRMGDHCSTWRLQKRGIRQGFPLSPYLFTISMIVLIRDVYDEVNLSRGRLKGLDFSELLYADDSGVFTNNVNAMNRLLAKIEEHAGYYGLAFN